MSIGGLLIGLLNIVLVCAVLILIGALVAWFASMAGYPIPGNIQKIFLLIVALVAIIMLVGMLLGVMPPLHVLRLT